MNQIGPMKTAWILLLWLALSATAGEADDLTLWYQQPAADNKPMDEALAIGNGRLGALVFGAPARERLSVNESSLWTGDENPTGDYDRMGAYQVFGNVFVHLPGQERTTRYRRDLDLGQALAQVSYEVGGVEFQREFFCSHPAGVLVARFTAGVRGGYTGRVELADSHGAPTRLNGNRMTVSGTLANGLKYEWQMLVLPEGGTVTTTQGAALEFKGCDRLTLLLVAGTDYAMDYAKHYRGADPHARLTDQLDAAAARDYASLRSEHLRDFQSLFNRVALDLGSSSEAQRALPTDRRKREAVQAVDPGLERLLFQYGRYLLIGCSRAGGLPANLQGLWNDNNNPPWHADYHANINVQMNYWPAEVANLAECHQPFFDLIQSQLPAWRAATAAAPEFRTADGGMTKRGFAIRTSHNIFGGLGWKWDKTANAWYCQHLWEHYAFGGDTNYLRRVAYPILKETCEFWEDHLKTLPDGRLVVPNGWSPEHGPDEDGVSYNQEIVWDLFNNFVQASDCARRRPGVPEQNRHAARPPGHARRRQLGPVARMDDREKRRTRGPGKSRARHARRSSSAHLALVRGLSRRANQRGPDAGTGPGGEGVARCARDRRRERRARVVVRVARGAVCALAGWRERAPHVAAVVLGPEYVSEPVRPPSADADGRQLRDHGRRRRDAVAESCRRDRTAARTAPGLAHRLGQGPARPRRLRSGYGVERRKTRHRGRPFAERESAPVALWKPGARPAGCQGRDI